ncbi:MAG: hypothetical protein PHX21_03775 [bacterium]|nr:hypothetical protein [bacterium]
MNIDKIKAFTEQTSISPSEKERDKKKILSSETDKSGEIGDSNLIKKISIESKEIDTNKIQQIKQKIEQGYYNRDDVKKEAIENLLNFLDIRG